MFRKSISFIAILILFSAVTSLMAQDSSSLAGKYALQFQVSQNFTLSNFLGSVISGKYHYSDASAIRLGVDFATVMANQSSGVQDKQTGAGNSNVSESNSQSVNVIVQYIGTPLISGNIRFYYGIGPKIGVGFLQDNSSASSSSHLYSYQKRSGKNYYIGFLCSAGVEWFFSHKMSLCAEYGVAYAYSYSKVNENYSPTTETEQKTYSYSFKGDNVRFGLSVYF